MKQIDARIYNGKTNFEWKDLELNSEGLLPVIVQDYIDHTVLMYTYMDESAWEKTLATGLLTYYSKSHKRAISKGKKIRELSICKRTVFKRRKECTFNKSLSYGSAVTQ